MDDQDKTHPLLIKKARAIAKALCTPGDLFEPGETWRAFHKYKQTAQLKRSGDGLTLNIYCDGALWKETVEWTNGHKLEVRGVYGKDHLGSQYSQAVRSLPTMAVTAGRDAPAIARDIRNRILEDVEIHQAKSDKWADESKKIYTRKKRLIESLARCGGGTATIPTQRNDTDYKIHRSSYLVGGVKFDGRLDWAGKHLDLEFDDIPPDLAKKILRTIKRYNQGVEDEKFTK
jgi:hypothetical protein